ncbi:MAG TPA: Clp protease N-terminal domain-containing protein [Streptosporangiaceae bacterium]|jgi:hypothetical protein
MDEIPQKLGTLIDYVDGARGGPLDKLEAAYAIAGTLSDQADHLIGHFVDQARRSGASWTEIGERMGGVTKQAAQKRFTIENTPDSMSAAKDKVFGRYTERAKASIVAAEAAARTHEHHYIGTEHLLLGVLAGKGTVGLRAIEACGVGVDALTADVEARMPGPSGKEVPAHIPFTAKSKKALELTLREALRLGHNYVGTEHILLGLIAEDSGMAAEVLRDDDLTTERVEAEVLKLLEPLMAPRPDRPGEK